MPLHTWDPNQSFAQPKLLVYGASGAGKTRFASTAPKPIFADAEKGMASVQIEGVGRWPINSMGDWGELMTFLETENHPDTGFQTLVVDSLNELQRLLNDFVLSRSPDAGRRPFGGDQLTQGDWGYALNLLENRVIRRLKDLPLNVIVICSTSGVVGAEGKVEPALYGRNTVPMVTRYMEVVGYMHVRRKEGGDKPIAEHVLGFHMPHAVSKDRSGRLPAEIVDPTWAKLASHWPSPPATIAMDGKRVLLPKSADESPTQPEKVSA